MNKKSKINKLISFILIINMIYMIGNGLLYLNATKLLLSLQTKVDMYLEIVKPVPFIENVEDIKKANVTVCNMTHGFMGSGTHIKINGEDYILTCAHMLDENNEDKLYMILENHEERMLEIIKVNHETDLALLKIKKYKSINDEIGDKHIDNLPYLKISKVFPKEGDKVYVIGNPSKFIDIISDGTIMAMDKEREGYIISNKIYYGSSGGALFLPNGKLIGVVSAFGCFSKPFQPIFETYGFAVNLKTITEFLKLIENEETNNE